MKVLALASYPERMAATRFRVSRYIPHLSRRGIDVELVPWLDDAAAARVYRRGNLSSLAVAAVKGFAAQAEAVAREWDAVLVQREAVLAGPPLIETLVWARRIPLILDYDDAIWIASGGPLKRAAKLSWKVDVVLREAAHAIAGSNSLAQRARNLGVPTTVLPTVVERDVWTPRDREHDSAELVIGWIGTHSTAPQLALVAPALRRLRAEGHRFRVLVIGAQPDFTLEGVDFDARAWKLEAEIDDFRSIDIGIAPMMASPWHEGKCGFKQVQFMAVGVPFVSSLIGGARDFVVDGENALVAHSSDDWYRQLRRLLSDSALRERLGREGRALVEGGLCIEAQANTLASVLRSVAKTDRRRQRAEGFSS